MVYRVLIGMIPMLFIAMIFTGVIPIRSLLGANDYRASAASSTPSSLGADAGKAGAAPTGAIRPPEKVTNAKEASDLFRSVDSSLDEEIKRRAPEEKQRKERLRRDRLRDKGQADWAPQGGWGS